MIKKSNVKNKNEPEPKLKKANKVAELISVAKANGIHEEINFGVIPNFKAQEVNAATGVFVRGATFFLNTSGIRHAFNGHGDHSIENARGQVGISDSDFELVPEILKDYDCVVKGNKGRKGQESIVFIKAIGKLTYHVVMSKNESKNGFGLVFNTMFIKK